MHFQLFAPDMIAFFAWFFFFFFRLKFLYIHKTTWYLCKYINTKSYQSDIVLYCMKNLEAKVSHSQKMYKRLHSKLGESHLSESGQGSEERQDQGIWHQNAIFTCFTGKVA